MATAPRYIRGETAPVFPPVATGTALNVGDLCAQVAGNVVPAASFTWTTDLPTTQGNFAAAFLGVSAQRKDAATMSQIPGNAAPNVCRTVGGIWEYNCSSASFNVGDLVGPAKDTGNALLNDTVASVASLSLAIGRVAEATSSATRVRVEIMSTLHPATGRA